MRTDFIFPPQGMRAEKRKMGVYRAGKSGSSRCRAPVVISQYIWVFVVGPLWLRCNDPVNKSRGQVNDKGGNI